MATLFGSSPSRTLGLNRRWLCGGALVLGLTALGCRKRDASPVYIVAGPEPSDHVEFRPISSYAEYLVLPGQRRELRITLASYVTSCDSFVAPADHDSSATITVIAPVESELSPGSYAWAGQAAHGGTEQQPERPGERFARSSADHGDANPAFGEPSRQFRMHKTQARWVDQERDLPDRGFRTDDAHASTGSTGAARHSVESGGRYGLGVSIN